jgi:hypothetical protein
MDRAIVPMASSAATLAVLRQATGQAAAALLESSSAQYALQRRVVEIKNEVKKVITGR